MLRSPFCFELQLGIRTQGGMMIQTFLVVLVFFMCGYHADCFVMGSAQLAATRRIASFTPWLRADADLASTSRKRWRFGGDGTFACSASAADAGSKVVYGELQHCGVLVDDVEVGLRFYVDVLGMEDVSHLRPTKLEYPGAFLQCGVNQIHLMKLPSMDPREGRPEHGGRDRHLAVTVANIDPLVENLTKNGVKYTMSKSGRRALFCRDPYQNAIEFVEDTAVA